MHTTDKLHIPVWGTFITTPNVSKESATIVVQTKINNSSQAKKEFTLITRIINPDGQEINKAENKLQLDSGMENETSQEITISSPELWDIDTPNLYNVLSQVIVNGNVVDEYKTTFGIRSIKLIRFLHYAFLS